MIIISRYTKKKSLENPLLHSLRNKLNLCQDVIYQVIALNKEISCTVVYIEEIVDIRKLQEHLLPMLINCLDAPTEELMGEINAGHIFPVPTETTKDIQQIVDGILSGNVAFLFSHMDFAILATSTTKYQTRSLSESQNELVIVGPQEAFIEDIHVNMSLLRHRIKHPDFKIIQMIIGKYTKTPVNLLYIDGICSTDLLAELEKQLHQINIDKIMGVSTIAEHIEQHPRSPFPQFQYTERPDTLASGLLEGRIAIMVDGTPMCIIVPATFFSLLQSAEDYYQRYISATWIRWIRYLFVTISFLLPSAYIAIITFNPEMIPPNLLITIAAAREHIPFPTIVEALIMEITFEGLREAGIRIPKPIGQTVSIIGAIVIGQAAVQAGIVSAPIVIVVSITGIASFVIPHFELGLSFRLLRFFIMILGGTLGLFGLIIGVYVIYCHLVNLNSFGIPYMKPFAPFVWKDWKDTIFRLPWPLLKKNKHEPYYTNNKPSKG